MARASMGVMGANVAALIGRALCTQVLKVLPENNVGWVIGAIAGAVIYVALMRGARRA